MTIWIIATATLLLGSLAAQGQTKFVATLECDKVSQSLSIDVGDHADHSLTVFQTECSWTKPIEIRQVRSTRYVGTATDETQGNNPTLHGYGVISFSDGSSATFRFTGTSIQGEDFTRGEGKWIFAEVTGQLKAISGSGVYRGVPTENGKRMYSISGVWRLPKSTPTPASQEALMLTDGL